MTIDILIINVHSWRNLGDAALYEAALSQIAASFSDSSITLAINDPESYAGADQRVISFFHWINHKTEHKSPALAWLIMTTWFAAWLYRLSHIKLLWVVPKPIRETFSAYLSADVIVNAPGGYFYSYGNGRDFLAIAYTMVLAELCGKPLYIFPQSIGPFKRQSEKWLTRFIFNHARIAMLRELTSLNYLVEIGVSASVCRFVPDTAFAFVGDPPAAAEEWLRSIGIDPFVERPLLGISVMNRSIQDPTFKNQFAYVEALCLVAVKFIEEHGGRVLVFSQTWGPSVYEDDRPITKQLVEHLCELGVPASAVMTPLPPRLLKALYGELDLLIGTRMHSNIFALSQNVPTIAVGYMHKTLGIASSLGLEEWVIDIRQVDTEVLTDKLNRIWSNRPVILNYLKKVIPETIEQASAAGEIVALDYQSKRGRFN